MPLPLYTPHSKPLTTLYSEIEQAAGQIGVVSPGTPGNIVVRSNASGTRFYAHQFYDADGRKRERYLAGPVGNAKADESATQLRDAIARTGACIKDMRMLFRQGYYRADERAYAAAASLHNHGYFKAGCTLLGTYAHGILLNHLGVRAAVYQTSDIDIGRGEALEFSPSGPASLLEALNDSAIKFVEAPRINVREPSTSFMNPGGSRFKVDLLVPAKPRGRPFQVVEVAEIRAHATSIPHLDYVLAETLMAPLIAREGFVPVRVPVPERMAWHKLLVSVLRSRESSKSGKDFGQGCVLLAVVGELDAQAVIDAAADIPDAAWVKLIARKEAIRDALASHPRALDALDEAAAARKSPKRRRKTS